MKYAATFPSEHFVMKAETILKDRDIIVRLIPTPRSISADCGMALEIEGEYGNTEHLKDLLKELQIKELDNVFKI